MQPFLASDFSNLGAFLVCVPAILLALLLLICGCIFRTRSLHTLAAIIGTGSGLILLHSTSYARGSDKELAGNVAIAAFVIAGSALLLAVFKRPVGRGARPL